jgi:8-oxo-dGTP pyrophosphatase MutT (NUDIX family)
MGEAERARAEDRGGTAANGAKRRRRRSRRRRSATRKQTPTTDAAATSQQHTGRPTEGSSKASRSSTGDAESGRRKGAAARRTRTSGAGAARRGATTGRAGSKSRRKTKRSGGSRRSPARVSTKREISSGGVVYRREGEEIEVVLASRRTRRGELAWGLAKGGIEQDESMEDAAVREVREETGLIAEIEASLGETRYFYVWEDVRIRKTVHFFLMRFTGGDVGDRDDEMEEIRWFPLDRALKRAAYRGEREVLSRAAELLR